MGRSFKKNIVGIDTENGLPRHYQVSQQIKKTIRLGHYKKGDVIPSERKLSEYFNVSRITIRRALEDLIKEEILEKILGKGTYVKDPSAFSMRDGWKIGITFFQDNYEAGHPATLEVLKGIGDIFLPLKDYSLEMLFVSSEIIKQFGYLDTLQMNKFDAIILAGQEIPSHHVKKLTSLLKNVVCTNRYQEDFLSVSVDYFSSSFQITEYLISLGHEKIALLNGPEGIPISNEVLKGYTKAMETHCLTISSEMIQYGSYDYTQGYTLTEMLLAKAEPTALIAGDDFMALGAIEALKKAGLQCPKDISIVSFNDFFFSKHTSPALSTVQIPFRKLGREVARNIVRLIEGETVSEKILKGEFIIRGSTSPVHHKARTGTHLNKQEI